MLHDGGAWQLARSCRQVDLSVKWVRFGTVHELSNLFPQGYTMIEIKKNSKDRTFIDGCCLFARTTDP